MDAIWKLIWALPLVLVTGAVLVLLLKHVVYAPASHRSLQRMRSCESLALSARTRLHLLELDGKAYLLVESERQAQLQPLEAGRGGQSS